jgi:hypothetical protein
MTLTRRNFLKVSALSGASFVTTSSLFFQKPAEAYSINYLLSNATVDSIFNNIVQTAIATDITETLTPDLNPIITAAVQSTQAEFTQREFNIDQTPYAQRLSNRNQPIWGRQKQEEVGPNPGFGTIQIVRNRATPIAFSGSTTVAIDRAVAILSSDARLSPVELDGSLIPIREQFEDWGTWTGDIDPRTGRFLGTSLTNYQTRLGEVTRRYQVVEPGPGGFGVIQMVIESGQEPRRIINIEVRFN